MLSIARHINTFSGGHIASALFRSKWCALMCLSDELWIRVVVDERPAFFDRALEAIFQCFDISTFDQRSSIL